MECPKRKQIRLADYDYSSAGAYFVTICTKDRRCILSEISVGAGVLDGPLLCLLPSGKIVEETIQEIGRHYDWLLIDNCVIMPNHIHLLLRMESDGSSGTPTPANARLPMLISTLKRFSNRKSGVRLWQRGYHEHVIRNETDYREIWNYIDTNPARWAEDRYYTE